MALTHHHHRLEELNGTQRRVHRILASSSKPLSAYDVLDKMRAEGAVTPPTVYRCLEKLIEKGLAHRLESLNAYVACQHPDHHDMAAFAICEQCGGVTEFTDEQLHSRLSQWSDGNAFSAKKVNVEIRGTCRLCSQ